MAFMGELSDISVADLLYVLGLRRQTGKLSINANGEEVSLFLEKGRLVLVTSSNMALRLGRMLLRLGLIDGQQLREALQEQELVGRGRPLGTLLIERGWLTEAELARCVEEQCIEILARVIAAEHGIFIYDRSASPPRRTEVVPLNADQILIEATRRTDELTTLRSLLPGPSEPLHLSPAIEDVAESLSDTEVLIASTLQRGAGTLGELTAYLAMDELTLWRTLISMRERGLIQATGDGSDASPGRGRA